MPLFHLCTIYDDSDNNEDNYINFLYLSKMFSRSEIIIQDYKNKKMKWCYNLDITTLFNIFDYVQNLSNFHYHLVTYNGDVHVKIFGYYICIYSTQQLCLPNIIADGELPSTYSLIPWKKLIQYRKYMLNIIRQEQYNLEAL